MLQSLSIRNYTLIDALDLDLQPGLSVITGETGAGKSIVLDALGLALGNRADTRALRQEAERMEVSAIFDLTDIPDAAAWLRERELEIGDECHLRRTLGRDGRSRGWINGQPATLLDMKAIGDMLVDLHGQHEHHALLKRASHQRLLDEFGGHGALAARVSLAHGAWRRTLAELEELRSSAEERRDRQQLLSYQLGELRELQLHDGELETLENDQQLLANAAELTADIGSVLALCEGDDGGGLLDALRQACSRLAAMGALGRAGAEVREMFDSALIQVDEARRQLDGLRDTIELNPQRLQEVEERLSAIYQLARKHRLPPRELPALEAHLASELAGLDASDERLGQMQNRVDALLTDWRGLAAELSEVRGHAAAEISARVREQLALMGMGNCRFDVAFRALEEPSALGAEQVEFLVSTNPGSAPEPLAKIASGGELSRISLAIQVVTATKSTTPTVIFDEVDVGIGGATADAVGQLLQSLGQRIQVICVTHLPQVASRGDHHLRASKTSSASGTSADLAPLGAAERVEEIARMLGTRTITRKTLEHAREMLEAGATGRGEPSALETV